MRGIWRILKWTGVALIASLALAWLGDYVSVEHRMARKTSTDPVESIIVRPVYAVARKDGKDEFDFGDAQTHTCIHSLFPHLGYSPCWYVIRQSQKAIPIGVVVPMVAIPMVAIAHTKRRTRPGFAGGLQGILHKALGNIRYSAQSAHNIN